DIEGDNYAPIRIIINFDTWIRNYGGAEANSGNVAAGGTKGTAAGKTASANTAGANSSSGSTQSSGSSSVTAAHGGSSTAIGNSVDANVVSQQLGSANG